jgi:hypothetical protein
MRIRSYKKIAVALSLISFLLFLVSLPNDVQHKLEEKQTIIPEQQDKAAAPKRPIIKTFFQPLADPNSNEVPQDPLLKVWKDEWEMAGFEPQVITMEDARKHPYYDTMKDAVEKVFKTDRYNQYCFFRYLAMATTGGGWHVDYDTIPANFPTGEATPLPNGGKFTSYQVFVPALISASEEEWTRVSKLIVEQLSISHEDLKSDMYMLRDLYLGNGLHDAGIDYKRPRSFVLEPEEAVKERHVINCERLNKALAIHFSHAHMAELYSRGAHPLDISNERTRSRSENRGKAIKVIMDEYRDQCKASLISETRE